MASIVLAGTIMLIIVAYHIYTTMKYNQYGLNLLNSPASIPLSFLLLFLSTWYTIFIAFHMFHNNISLSYCYFSLYVGPGTYALFKLTLCLILILRLHGSFKNSPLQYSPFKLKIWASILVIWQITNITMHVFTGSAAYDPNGLGVGCQMRVRSIVYISFGVLDLVSASFNLYLFIKPVLELRQAAKTKDFDLKHLAIKQCILSMVAILSTIVAIIGMVTTPLPQLFLGIDLNLSCFSIIGS